MRRPSAGRAGRRAHQHVVGLGRHVLAQQLTARAEAAGGEDSGLPPGGSLRGCRGAASPAALGERRGQALGGRSERPVVSSLPVSRSTTGAPSDSSQRQVLVEALEQDALEAPSPPGHSSAKPLEVAVAPDDAAGQAHRAARALEASRHDGAAPRAARLGRHPRGRPCPAPATASPATPLRPGRSPGCARRTRSGLPTDRAGKTASVLGASLTSSISTPARLGVALQPRRRSRPAARCG